MEGAAGERGGGENAPPVPVCSHVRRVQPLEPLSGPFVLRNRFVVPVTTKRHSSSSHRNLPTLGWGTVCITTSKATT